MNKGLRPKTRLQYVGYEIGDYAMVRAIPKLSTNIWVDDSFVKLNDKLQPRYSGPYKILDELTPVTYLLLINEKPKRVHASNMKPYSGRKNVLTQYVEPGYDREEGVGGIAKEPLLLSPIPGLNQMARVKFKLRNAGTSRTISELKRAEREWNEREAETNLRMSQVPSDMWVMEEATQEEILQPIEESQAMNSSSGTGITPVTDLSTSNTSTGGPVEETNMLVLDEPTTDPSITVINETVAIKEQPRTVGASWVAKVKKSIVAKRASRNQILQAAGITPQELDIDPERKTRIDAWIRELSSEGIHRRSKLSRSRKQMESVTMVTPSEVIGWTLQEKERAWAANPLNSISQLDRPKSRLRRAEWRESKFSPEILTAYDTPLTTPETNSQSEEQSCSSLKRASGAKPTPTSETLVEEVNCLVIDEWDSKSITSETVDSATIYEMDRNYRFHQEMIYSREHWHNFLLRLGSRLVVTEYPELPDPAAYTRWDSHSPMKLRVELDAEIPIPLGMRKIWYSVQEEIRQFKHTGLLIPSPNTQISPRERWRNKTTEQNKLVSTRVYDYLQEAVQHSKTFDTNGTKYQLSYFFPLIRGRVTISYHPTSIKPPSLTAIEKAIRRKYDSWYWNALRKAETIEPDRRSGSTSTIRVRYNHDPAEWRELWRIPTKEWKTVLFYMKDAIDRNGSLPEPPGGLGKSLYRC